MGTVLSARVTNESLSARLQALGHQLSLDERLKLFHKSAPQHQQDAGNANMDNEIKEDEQEEDLDLMDLAPMNLAPIDLAPMDLSLVKDVLVTVDDFRWLSLSLRHKLYCNM